jgi:hypothetical protein
VITPAAAGRLRRHVAVLVAALTGLPARIGEAAARFEWGRRRPVGRGSCRALAGQHPRIDP